MLLAADGVVDPAGPGADVRAGGADAVVVHGEAIAWVGRRSEAPTVDAVVDLGGTWIAPAYTDAHVHATATGLAESAADLRGATSAAAALDVLAAHAAGLDADALVRGVGWDETTWPEGAPPHADDLARACGGRSVLAVRVDGHACAVDRRLLDRIDLAGLDGVVRDDAGAPTGWLREQASEAAQVAARGLARPADTEDARLRAVGAAARLGIATIHEMGHPGLSGLDDAVAWAAGEWAIDVEVWWADLDVGVALANGLRPGGDLFLDGSFGSCTAAVSEAYSGGGTGELFADDAAVADFYAAATAAGQSASVHAIGDVAVDQAIRALEAVAAVMGAPAVRSARHRIEHVEQIDRDRCARLAELGVTASIQPAFDAAWGGESGMYAARLGAERALRLNPFAWLHAAGVHLALGSDSTVTPIDPWGGVMAATAHRGGLSIDRRTAFAAHTAGGHRSSVGPRSGRVAATWRADLACLASDPLDDAVILAPPVVATLSRGRCAYGPMELDDALAGAA